jgi:hypothetical protein
MGDLIVRCLLLFYLFLWTSTWTSTACGQTFFENDTPRSGEAASPTVDDRLAELERLYAELADENRRLAVPTDAPAYVAGYYEGFFVSPNDPTENPFELKLNFENQFRYTGFARDVRTWTDSTGTVSPVTNRSNFELPRGRIIFSGFAFVPQLSYNVNIDYNTVSSSQINFRSFWLGYRFNRAFELFVGQNKVPGSREWLTSFLYTQGPDRSLATTFFRPSLSQGIWATGELFDHVFYHTMISNGFNTLGANPQQLDSRMTLSGSVWSEPWGDFGPGYSDFEGHESPAIRFGKSLTYSPLQGQQGDPDFPENNDLRLSNGTLLTATGALAPGVTLSSFEVLLGAFDLGFKYKGFSASGEFYLQDLRNLQGNGPLPRSSIFNYGGFVQSGYFVMPQKLECYARTSQITGPYGSGGEYAGGVNWFFLPGKQNLRFTLEVDWINHSPADQNRTDYRAGDTGLLVRSQIQSFF